VKRRLLITRLPTRLALIYDQLQQSRLDYLNLLSSTVKSVGTRIGGLLF
jgi:hypothetical protein